MVLQQNKTRLCQLRNIARDGRIGLSIRVARPRLPRAGVRPRRASSEITELRERRSPGKLASLASFLALPHHRIRFAN
jgi:hypothetical protein